MCLLRIFFEKIQGYKDNALMNYFSVGGRRADVAKGFKQISILKCYKI